MRTYIRFTKVKNTLLGFFIFLCTSYLVHNMVFAKRFWILNLLNCVFFKMKNYIDLQDLIDRSTSSTSTMKTSELENTRQRCEPQTQTGIETVLVALILCVSVVIGVVYCCYRKRTSCALPVTLRMEQRAEAPASSIPTAHQQQRTGQQVSFASEALQKQQIRISRTTNSPASVRSPRNHRRRSPHAQNSKINTNQNQLIENV